MKLVHPFDYRKPRRMLDISDAVEMACEGSGDGVVETVRDSQRETAALLGRLVHELHEAGALSDEAVLRVVGSMFEAVG